jgi:hypothetical protein
MCVKVIVTLWCTVASTAVVYAYGTSTILVVYGTLHGVCACWTAVVQSMLRGFVVIGVVDAVTCESAHGRSIVHTADVEIVV